MKKQAPVYSFDVRFTGKQAKAIESLAKSKGVTPEAMVRQAVRDALEKANNKTSKHEKQDLEDYVLGLLGNRRVVSTNGLGARSRNLEKRVLKALAPTEAIASAVANAVGEKRPVKAPVRKATNSAAAKAKSSAKTSAKKPAAKKAAAAKKTATKTTAKKAASATKTTAKKAAPKKAAPKRAASTARKR